MHIIMLATGMYLRHNLRKANYLNVFFADVVLDSISEIRNKEWSLCFKCYLLARVLLTLAQRWARYLHYLVYTIANELSNANNVLKMSASGMVLS